MSAILRELILTEKANLIASELNQYVFSVCVDSNKYQIAKAVSEEFGVKVVRVNVINQRGKMKLIRSSKSRQCSKSSDVKKAIVFLAKGEKIDIA